MLHFQIDLPQIARATARFLPPPTYCYSKPLSKSEVNLIHSPKLQTEIHVRLIVGDLWNGSIENGQTQPYSACCSSGGAAAVPISSSL